MTTQGGKIRLWLPVLGLCVVLLFPGCGGGSRETGRASGEPGSLRNECAQLVQYSVSWEGNTSYPLQYALEGGEIERLPDREGLVVSFYSGGDVVRRPLESGKSYSFRLSGDGELRLEEGWLGSESPQNLAPFLASPMEVVDGMLELAGAGPSDLVCDLGSGDGRIPIRAAVRFGARGLGIEYNPSLVERSRAAARAAGVEDRVEFRLGDVLKSDFSDATVVTIYLLSASNLKLRPTLEDQLRRGTPVVTHDFPIPGWEGRLVETRTLETNGEIHSIRLYRR